ncbi:MAG: hypothetical protein ACTHJ2_05405, partial [Candidatus Nitrosocosmicus sp.]
KEREKKVQEKQIEMTMEIEDIDNKDINETADKANDLPDLIIIDGGKGHLNVALKALKKIGQEKLECISLAKENEEIFLPFSDSPLVISRNRKSLRILQHIRDESHRFGLTYNQKLRKLTP